jgi:hypothetical protein
MGMGKPQKGARMAPKGVYPRQQGVQLYAARLKEWNLVRMLPIRIVPLLGIPLDTPGIPHLGAYLGTPFGHNGNYQKGLLGNALYL